MFIVKTWSNSRTTPHHSKLILNQFQGLTLLTPSLVMFVITEVAQVRLMHVCVMEVEKEVDLVAENISAYERVLRLWWVADQEDISAN